MSLASIRLCRELYDLSGWDDTYHVHGVAIDYSLSQEPFKFVALSDIEAERGNLKQLSEGDNHECSK